MCKLKKVYLFIHTLSIKNIKTDDTICLKLAALLFCETRYLKLLFRILQYPSFCFRSRIAPYPAFKQCFSLLNICVPKQLVTVRDKHVISPVPQPEHASISVFQNNHVIMWSKQQSHYACGSKKACYSVLLINLSFTYI